MRNFQHLLQKRRKPPISRYRDVIKKILVISVSLVCMTSLFAQHYSEDELRLKLNSSLNKKHVGQGLVIAGVGINIIGFGIMNWGSNERASFSSKSGERAFAKIIGGAMIVVAGQVIIGIGIPIWISGGSRSNHYKRLLKNYDNNLSLKITNRGVGLHYHF